MATFNFYNRVSSSRIVTSSQLSKKTKALDDVGRDKTQHDDMYSDSDLADDVESLLSEETAYDEATICGMIHRNLAIYDELSRSVEKLTDSAISPDSDGQFLKLRVKGNFTEQQKQIINRAHNKVITMLGFGDHIEAWKTFYEFASYGKVAYRIKYDTITEGEREKELKKLKDKLSVSEVRLKESSNSQKYKDQVIKQNKAIAELSGMKQLDRFGNDESDGKIYAKGIKKIEKINFLYLSKQIDKDSGKTYWKYKNSDRELSDNEIILIKYNDIGGKHLPLLSENRRIRKVSYAHKIIRSYNILRRMETTVVAWTILNAMYRQVSTIPITTKVSSKAKEAISKVRNKYLDTFVVDDNGEVQLNGESTFNYMKHITLGNRQGNKAEVGTVQYSGFDMSNMKIVEYFRERYRDDTRLPNSRYDTEGRSGGLTIFKADGVPFNEVDFHNYMDRTLHQFSNIIKKPTKLLASIEDNSLPIDSEFETSIGYTWESMHGFLEAKKAEEESKKLSNIDQMLRFTDSDRNPIFPPKYLFVEKTEFMTEEEWDKMEEYKDKEGNKES